MTYSTASTADLTATGTLQGAAPGIPWWRPTAALPEAGAARAIPAAAGGTLAFGALVAFTAILILSPQNWFPVLKVFRVAFLAAAIAMAAHVAERTAHRRPTMPLSPEIGIALALVCWAIVTLPLSVWPGGSVRLLTDYYLKAIAFFWLLAAIVNTPARLSVLGWTLTLCAIPLAATGIYNYVSGEVLFTGVQGFYRISGYAGSLTANPNDLALMLNLILPITGALAFASRGALRWIALATLVLSVSAVVLTYSRAGFLTLAAMGLMFVGLLFRRRSPGLAIVILIAAICLPPLLPDGYLNRLGTIANIEADETRSAQGRWRDTKVAASLVARSPLIGAGIGQDILVMNEERGLDTWRRVHNAYLQYGVDLGILGLLLFAWLHLSCYRAARAVDRRAMVDPSVRGLQPMAVALQVSLVGFGVAAMFHPIAYQFFFFTVAGLAVALRNTCRSMLTAPAPEAVR